MPYNSLVSLKNKRRVVVSDVSGSDNGIFARFVNKGVRLTQQRVNDLKQQAFRLLESPSQ